MRKRNTGTYLILSKKPSLTLHEKTSPGLGQ